jgi:hypothetical protein
MKERTISYIVVGENPLSGIFKSQLYNRYNDLRIFSRVEIVFIVNPFLWLRVRGEVRRLQESYLSIDIRLIPLQLIPERYMRLHLLITMLGNFWNLVVFRFLKCLGVIATDIIVARSYYAGYILSYLKKSESSIVFDPRSIYPLERYSHRYIKSQAVYDYWLSWERKMINRFDSVISVSRGMTEYYAVLNSNVTEVFLNSGMRARNGSINPAISQKLRLVYWGSLVYESHNNSWVHYKNRLKEIERSIGFPVEVDFFVPFLDNRIKDTQYCGNIKINFFQGLNGIDITKYHAAIYFIPISLDTFSRLGIKTVEYLSQNLPIIFDDGMSDFVTKLLTKNSAGFNLNNFRLVSLEEVGDNPLRVYNDNFSSETSLKNLRHLYASFSTKS